MYAALSFDDVCSEYFSASAIKVLIDFLKKKKILGTFFVTPNFHGGKLSKELRSALEAIRAFDHEVGLHGYVHTSWKGLKGEFGYLSPYEFGFLLPFPFPRYQKQLDLIRKSRDSLVESSGIEPIGFRAPNYRHNTLTLRALASQGFRYDSSKTVFKPAHLGSFRFRTLIKPKPIEIGGFTEIPVVGDYVYSLKRHGFVNTLKEALRDFEWVRALNGVFVVNTHIQQLDGTGMSLLNDLVARIINKAELVRLSDLVS